MRVYVYGHRRGLRYATKVLCVLYGPCTMKMIYTHVNIEWIESTRNRYAFLYTFFIHRLVSFHFIWFQFIDFMCWLYYSPFNSADFFWQMNAFHYKKTWIVINAYTFTLAQTYILHCYLWSNWPCSSQPIN